MRHLEVAVAGGGLVGAAVAYGLAGRGLRVAVLDEGDVALRASRGNFGLVWVQGKGVGYPAYARWSRHASEIWAAFAEELDDLTGVDVAYRRPGGVLIALDEAELAANVAMLERLRREAGNHGYDFEVLEGARLRDLLPDVGSAVPGGTYCPHDGHANPLRLLRGLHAGVVARGGTYLPRHRVRSIRPAAGGGFELDTAGGPVGAERVVIAAGLGGAALAPGVGLRLPVSPLQGQIVVTERAPPRLALPTNLVRQTDEGTFLLGYSQADVGLSTATSAATLRDIAWRCSRAFPFLADLRVVRAWAALRIMTPDGFPIYERSEAHSGAYAVTCHSGVTLAASHAGPVADWIAGGGPAPEPIAPFSTRRLDVQTAD